METVPQHLLSEVIRKQTHYCAFSSTCRIGTGYLNIPSLCIETSFVVVLIFFITSILLSIYLLNLILETQDSYEKKKSKTRMYKYCDLVGKVVGTRHKIFNGHSTEFQKIFWSSCLCGFVSNVDCHVYFKFI